MVLGGFDQEAVGLFSTPVTKMHGFFKVMVLWVVLQPLIPADVF